MIKQTKFDNIINKIYVGEKMYVYLIVREIISDISNILKDDSEITIEDISELIYYLFMKGIKCIFVNGGKINKSSPITQSIDIIPISGLIEILELLTYNNILLIDDVDFLLGFFSKFTESYDHIWIGQLIANGYIPTKKQIIKIKKFRYSTPLKHSFDNNKISIEYLEKHLSTENGVKELIDNPDLFISCIKENNVILSSKIVLRTLCNPDLEKNKQINNIPILLDVFEKCNYQFDTIDLLTIILNMEEKNKNNKINILNILNFVKKTKIDYKNFITEAIIVSSKTLDYFYETKELDKFDKKLVIKSAILHKNLDIVKFCINEKYIADNDDLLLVLCCANNHTWGSDCEIYNKIFGELIKSGAVITKQIFELLVIVGWESIYEHLYNESEIKKNKIIDNINIMINMTKSLNTMDFLPLFYTEAYTFDKNKKINIENNLEIFCENKLNDILSYIKQSKFELTDECFDMIFQSKYPIVCEYFKFKYNVKPSLLSIVFTSDVIKKMFLVNFHYPDLLNKIKNTNVENNSQINFDTFVKNKKNGSKKIKI